MRQITTKLSKIAAKFTDLVSVPTKALKSLAGSAIVEQVGAHLGEFLATYGVSIEGLSLQNVLIFILIGVIAYEIIGYILSLFGLKSFNDNSNSDESTDIIPGSTIEDYSVGNVDYSECCFDSEFCFSECDLE